MKKNMINETHIEGYLYSVGTDNGRDVLQMKVSGPESKTPNTQFIAGTINIATDEAGMNIVPVHFTYVTATTSKGKPNRTFDALKSMIDTDKMWSKSGKENAIKVRIDSAIGLNEFFTDPENDEAPVSVRRNEGGFVHIVDTLNENEDERNTWAADMLIVNTTRVDGDEEKGTSDKVVVKGYIFNFRNELLPVDFDVVLPDGMTYFENMDVSPKEPIFTKIWGQQESQVFTTKITEESGFGTPVVKTRKTSRKAFLITGIAKEAYPWDDEDFITGVELTKAMGDREVALATMRKNAIDFASKKNASVGAKAVADGSGYKF